MKSTKFFKTISSDEGTEIEDESIELLLDPIRSKIVSDIILNGEATADTIVENTGKSRSTIAHHLKKLVENNVLDVFMNPTGKTKYYRLSDNIKRLMYTLDKEKFSSGTEEEKSDFIIEIHRMFGIVNHIYANIFTDQIKLIQEKYPFHNISMNEFEDISYKINDQKIITPYLTYFITGEDQAEFIKEGLRKLMKEFTKKFQDFPDVESMINIKPKYIINLQILQYLDRKELE